MVFKFIGMRKVRINITVDEKLLRQTRKKLGLFGGKISTLFNAFLDDFVKSVENKIGQKEFAEKVKELEKRMDKIESCGKIYKEKKL